MLLTLLVIILGIVPGLIWLVFFIEEDTRPEPLRDIILTLVLAAMTTLTLAAMLQVAVPFLRAHGYTNFVLDSNFSRPELLGIGDYGTLFGLAFLEEFVKFLAVFIGVRRLADFDQPVDVMVYLIIAAMGFAMVENIGANLNTIGSTASLGLAIQVTVMRFIGAALLHGLTSGVVGYYWARGILKRHAMRFVFFGLVFATILHTIFNYLILVKQSIFIPTLFLVALAFFIFIDFEELKQIDKLPAEH